MISVNRSVAYKIGYIPRNLAYVISAGISLKTVFKEVRGHYTRFMNYGAVITLQLS